MRKKVILILFLSVTLLFTSGSLTFAAEEPKNIDEAIGEVLDNLDLSALEDYYKYALGSEGKNEGLKDIIKRLVSGDDERGQETLVRYAFGILLGGIKERLPVIVTLFALLITCGILGAVKSDKSKSGVGEIAYFAVYSAIVCLVTALIYSLIAKGKEALSGIVGFIQAVFPVILTLMSVTGNASSAAIYTPSVAFITNFSVTVVENILFPVIVAMMALSVVSNINKNVKLKGLIAFLGSTAKWIIGLISAIFSVFLTVKGISAAFYDGISVRALKYTVNSSVPIVGGLLKEGFELIVASAALIRNAFGLFAVFGIFYLVIGPILEIVALSLVLKLVSALTEPIGDGRANEFINSLSGALNYLVACLVMVSLMFIVTIAIIMLSTQSLL